MRNITSVTELRQEITLLEIKQKSDGFALREQFKITYESLRPINLIKTNLKELITSPDLKENLVNSTIGIGAGYLTKKVAFGSTHNPIKQFLGTLLQVAITSIASKNAEVIKSGAMELINSLFPKKNKAQ